MQVFEQTWLVPADHPAFAGHFPAQPILPGVVLLDLAVHFAAQATGNLTSGWQVSQAKFHSPCGPGELLNFNVQLLQQGRSTFAVRCGERDIASGKLQALAP